jgi:hypothetical protein
MSSICFTWSLGAYARPRLSARPKSPCGPGSLLGCMSASAPDRTFRGAGRGWRSSGRSRRRPSPTTRRCTMALLVASLVVVGIIVYWVYNGGKFRLG